MNKLKFDSYDGVCFFNGLVFFAPVALLVRTHAGVSEHTFFLLQALLSAIIFLGEIPTGFITDKIGYRKSLIFAQILLLCARVLLLLAFMEKSLPLFVMEAVAEGIAVCFTSGTGNAYLYDIYKEEEYLLKMTHAENCGTAGFIISTIFYAVIYKTGGLEGLLITTVISNVIAVVISFFLKKDSTKNCGTKSCGTEKSSGMEILSILKKKEALFFMLLLSIFSVAWLFINFFYVEKLTDCGIPAEWLSVVILIYSAIQMLAEPILGKLQQFFKPQMFCLLSAVGGVAFLLFGRANNRVVVLLLMVFLPLLISLPEYLLNDLENQFVDETEHSNHRAAALSVLNMGVNFIDVASLFVSAALTQIGISWCFLLIGGLLLGMPAVIFKILSSSR